MQDAVSDIARDATIASVAHKATYAGAGVATYGGLTANEIAAFGGLIIAVVGVLIQLLFRLREDRRNAEYHRERLANVRSGRHE